MQHLDVLDVAALDGEDEALGDEGVDLAVLAIGVPFLPARLAADRRRLLVAVGRFLLVAGLHEHRVRREEELIESRIDDLDLEPRVALRVAHFGLRERERRRHALAGRLCFFPAVEIGKERLQIAEADRIHRLRRRRRRRRPCASRPLAICSRPLAACAAPFSVALAACSTSLAACCVAGLGLLLLGAAGSPPRRKRYRQVDEPQSLHGDHPLAGSAGKRRLYSRPSTDHRRDERDFIVGKRGEAGRRRRRRSAPRKPSSIMAHRRATSRAREWLREGALTTSARREQERHQTLRIARDIPFKHVVRPFNM